MKIKTIWILLGLLMAAISLGGQTPSPSLAVPDTLSPVLPDSMGMAITDSLQTAQDDSLFYSAERIWFEYDKEQIWLYGEPQVNYQDSEITADSLLIDLKQERARSYGPTRMKDGDQLLIGDNVRYDVDTQTGIIQEGQSLIDKGFYHGIEIRKTGKDIYDIDSGRFTSCDLEEPSYWFWAKKLRVYRGDKVVGKPVIAYVNHFPVFYFPFISVPLRRGRHAGFLIPEPGYNSVDGKYLREIGWYYPYKDYADLVVNFDLTEKSGWTARFNTDYIKRYLYNGGFDLSYQHDINTGVVTNDWSMQGKHHHDLPGDATLDVNIDYISNKRIWQGSSDIDQSLAQRLTSSIAYRQTIGSSYLNVGSVFTQDLVNDNVSISLPSASFNLSTRPLVELFGLSSDSWLGNLSYYYNTRLDHTGAIKEKGYSFSDLIWNNSPDPADTTGTSFINEHHLGMRHALGLGYSWKYRGWLSFRQGIDFTEAWMDRDKNDQKWVRGYDWSANLNSSFNLYGMRNFANLPIKSLRHVMTPSLGISYQPDSRRNEDLYYFGGIGVRSGEKAATLNYALEHKWQIKYGEKDKEKRINDLFTLSSRGSASLYKDDKPLGMISHNLAFNPGSIRLGNLNLNPEKYSLGPISLAYGAQFSMQHDPYQIRWNHLDLKNEYFAQSITLGGSAPYQEYYPGIKNSVFSSFGSADSLNIPYESSSQEASSNNWSLTIGHDLYSPRSIFHSQNNNLRTALSCNLTENWGLSYSNYYNLKDKRMLSQSFRVSRNLHCWKLDISINRRNEYWDYRIVLYNLLLPDALKFQTRDNKKY